ncbi:hypothetical protein ACGFYQ_34255 [Streptomyces sp. NPDC048258]|uniref:hypothetical protein n=1 Tax=Streptomyces sp. NPDC048258 TaxID=3365527 RepID=UPI003715845A
MAEGLQAGRLEVTVISVLDGFARELRTKVEAAAEGLSVKVKVKVDDSGLRKRLEKAVEKASRGVTATVRVKIDHNRLRTELDAAARQVASTDLDLPVRPDGDGGGAGGGGGLRDRLRRLLRDAQTDADRSPVNVPVKMKLPGGRGRRGGLRMLGMGALVALAQPAVAWVGQLGAGLTALTSAAVPAVGILGTLPGLISAAGLAAISTKVAFGGFGEGLKEAFKAQAALDAGTKRTKKQQQELDQAMKGLSKSARATVYSIVDVSEAWKGLRSSVQERFFSEIADQVEPLSAAVLPHLDAALGSSASQVGKLVRSMSVGAQTKSFAKDFDQVAASSNKVTGTLIRGLKNSGAAVGNFVVASGPAVERVAALTEGWTAWLRATSESNRASGRTDAFLQRTIDKSKQLIRITADLGHGLAGLGRAGRESGESLLSGLQFQMKYFNAWANSTRGQKRMKEFFDGSLPVYRETIGLLGDLGKGLARMSRDKSLVELVRQIRYELMPSVGSFLDQLGRAVGPQLISLLANLAGTFQQLSAAGLGLAVIVQAFAALALGANRLLQAVPGLGVALGGLLGALLALRVLRTVSTMMGGLGRAVTGASTALAGTPGRVTQAASAWQRAGLVYDRVSQQTGGLTGAARGATAASRVMARGLTGVLGIVGGPLGLALAAGSIALMWYAERQQQAAQAAAEHRAQVQTLADALQQSNGVIDNNVVAQARKLAVESDWGKAAGKAGVSTLDLTKAILGQGTSLDQVEKKLRAAADATYHWESKGKADAWVMTEQGKTALKAADAIKKHGTNIAEARKELDEMGIAQDALARKGTSAYDRVRDAVKRLADSTGDAEGRTSALKNLLDALSGKTKTYEEATKNLNARLLEMQEYAKANAKAAEGKSVMKDGSLDTSNQLGQDIYRMASGLADDALSKVTAAFDKASAAGKPLVEALAAARNEAQLGRDQLISWLQSLGVSADEAKAVADQMKLIPDQVVTGLKLEGQDQVTITLAAIQAQFKESGTQTIVVDTLDEPAREKLRSLMFTTKDLPNGQIAVTAQTDMALMNLNNVLSTANNVPSNKTVSLTAVTEKAQSDLVNVAFKVADVKDKSFTMTALTDEARRILTELGYKIETLPGANGAKQLTITAPPGTAQSNVSAIQGAVSSLHGTHIYVDVSARFGDGMNSDGSVHVSGMGHWANGGILKFANGGIHRAGAAVRAFANGSEQHIAQIAKAGEMRVWAEPETAPGEAYIPLAPSKRKRSSAILDTVARFFGGMVVYPGADNGMRQYANGAVALHAGSRASLTASAPRASIPQAAPALVGGDLNLTMTSTPISPSEALNDTMFELRRIRRGGAHAAG